MHSGRFYAVDETSGILRGVVVAEIGDATGHFVALDKAGQIIGVDDLDIPGTVRRIPLAADTKTLETIEAAGNAGTGTVRTREDHDDSIGARAGSVSKFRIVGTKVVCDLALLDAYANRAAVIEAATKTPELLGLSGDFKFDTEIIGDRAYMRVVTVSAVDIVDEGALTPGGLA